MAEETPSLKFKKLESFLGLVLTVTDEDDPNLEFTYVRMSDGNWYTSFGMDFMPVWNRGIEDQLHLFAITEKATKIEY